MATTFDREQQGGSPEPDDGGRIAVVIGGTSGIALGIAQELVALGFRHLVLLFLRDVDSAKEAEALLKLAGATVSLVQGNIAEQSTVDAVYAAVDEVHRARREARLATLGCRPKCRHGRTREGPEAGRRQPCGGLW